MRALWMADALMICEAREFDCVEYFRDANALSHKKGVLLLAHEVAGDFGLEAKRG